MRGSGFLSWIAGILAATLLVGAVAWTVVGHRETERLPPSPGGAGGPALAQITRTGTVRCGYVVYANLVAKDPNTGALSGIFVDLTERLGAILGWKILWTAETTFENVAEDLRTGKYDVFCGGAWPVFPPAVGKANSIGAFYSPVMVYVRTDDPRFVSGPSLDLHALNDPALRVVTMDGELSQIVARDDFPRAQTLQLPASSNVAEAALSVATHKADFAILERALAEGYTTQNPGVLREMATDRPVRVFANTWEFAPAEVHLRHTFDRAIQQLLDSGAVETVLRQYESTPGIFLRVAPAYQNVAPHTPSRDS